jgi:hypothetical protein
MTRTEGPAGELAEVVLVLVAPEELTRTRTAEYSDLLFMSLTHLSSKQ